MVSAAVKLNVAERHANLIQMTLLVLPVPR